MKRDFFVYDEYGDVWNVEPIKTFREAREFRDYIKPRLVGRHILQIRSAARIESAPSPIVRTKHQLQTELFAGMDF